MAGLERERMTRRERFLGEMDAVIPWSRLVKQIEPHYPKAEPGHQPRTILRFAPAGAAWADRGDLQFDHRPAGRTATVAALGHHCGRDHHRGAEFDQECECDPRPLDEANPQGPQMVFRDEAARRHGPTRYRAYGESDRCQRSRHYATA